MRSIIRLLSFLLIFALTGLFNAGLIDIRFEEIRYLLGTIAATDEMAHTFGIVAKYELIKRRMQYGEENITNYEFEAKIQALTSGDIQESDENKLKKKIYRLPVRYILNSIRYILGKPIINPKEDDKVYGILEIGYFWERNRRYSEALKIYEEVLSTPHINPEIRAAILVHKAFCYSMISRYDKSKLIYEQVINTYPNTEAGIVSWKLLDFINSMENERERVQKKKLTIKEKARQFYLLMDFRNAIKNYSVFLSEKQTVPDAMEARFFKGRSHEELGETEEALMEYRSIIRKDKSKVWARQANRRMLMLGEFYNRQKSIAEEAKRQLEAYQDEVFIKNVEKYSKLIGKGTLKEELAKKLGSQGQSAANDSILQFIDQIGDIGETGSYTPAAQKNPIDKIPPELVDKGTLSKAEIKKFRRKQLLARNPYRRPSALKKYIDNNSSELRYIYNKRLRTGIKLSGKMLIGIKIMADGTVPEAKVIQSNMGDVQFEQKIVQQIQTWKFKAVPDSLGDLTVNYPFEFFEEE